MLNKESYLLLQDMVRNGKDIIDLFQPSHVRCKDCGAAVSRFEDVSGMRVIEDYKQNIREAEGMLGKKFRDAQKRREYKNRMQNKEIRQEKRIDAEKAAVIAARKERSPNRKPRKPRG